MSADTLRPRPLKLDHQLSQELRVPLVFVRLEQFIRLFVREEVEDQRPQRGRGADLLVQYARVAGRRDGVSRFAKSCNAAQDVIAQWRCEQAIAEPVQINEQEVFRTASVIPQIAVCGRLSLHELRPGRRCVEHLVMVLRREVRDLVCRARDSERACI